MRSVVCDSFNVFPLSFKAVQQSSKSDPVIKKVYQYIQEGWPKSLASNADRELVRSKTAVNLSPRSLVQG